MKQRNLYRIIIGALMLISGLVSIIMTGGELVISTILLTAGLVFLITGLGSVLQVTVGTALKRRSIKRIKRQLEDMKVMESSADNRKDGKGDKGGGSSF